MYQKEIIYLGLFKDGSRFGSAGFLKAEKRDKTSVLTMVVKNIPLSVEGRFPVRYCFGADTSEEPDRGEWKEEDGITLRDGGGVWEKKELEASKQIRVQILLPNGYLVEGESKAAIRQTPPKREAQTAAAFGKPSVPAVESTAAAPSEPADEQRDIFAAGAMDERRNIPAAEPVEKQRDISAAEPVEKQRDIPAAEPAEKQSEISAAFAQQSVSVTPQRPPLMADALAIEGLKEDKWEQILDTYDQIHPYGDDRVYVKIAPKDFIILSGNCQHLVNNSFLLHGFYNYRYVILGKEGDYCLGVPGVFYEREKMVALMFGFEAFECEGGDPKPGDFGYYLRKVEL